MFDYSSRTTFPESQDNSTWTPGHMDMGMWQCGPGHMGTLIVEERFHFKMLETAMDLLRVLGRLNLLSTYNLAQRREYQVRPEPGWQLMWNVSDPDTFNTTYSATFLLDMRTHTHLKTASGWQKNHYAKIHFHHHHLCPLRLPCCLSTKPPLTSAGMSRDVVMTVTMTSISTFVTKTITLSINIRINNHDKDIFWGIWCRLQIVVELLHDHHSFHTWCSCHGMSMVTMVMAMIATTIRWRWRHIATHS